MRLHRDEELDSQKEYIESNFNSNNTVKYDFNSTGDHHPRMSENSSHSRISKIRNELQFPSIKMNKIEDIELKVSPIENLQTNLRGEQQPIVQRISLQPSLQTSDNHIEEEYEKQSSENSILEQMCHDISDIKLAQIESKSENKFPTTLPYKDSCENH